MEIGYKGSSPTTYKFTKSWQEEVDLARSCLNKATKWMKKWTDKKWRHVEFNVGGQLLVKLHNILWHNDVHNEFVWRYEGTFQVLKRVGKVAYKVEFLAKLKFHSMFHMSMLKLFQEDKEDPSWAKSSCAPLDGPKKRKTLFLINSKIKHHTKFLYWWKNVFPGGQYRNLRWWNKV